MMAEGGAARLRLQTRIALDIYTLMCKSAALAASGRHAHVRKQPGLRLGEKRRRNWQCVCTARASSTFIMATTTISFESDRSG